MRLDNRRHDRGYRGDDLGRLDAELQQAQRELETLSDDRIELGVVAEEGKAAGAPDPASSRPSRCERIAALAGRICQLRDHMCALADEHDEQARYAEACGRAEQTCQQAKTAADDCAAA